MSSLKGRIERLEREQEKEAKRQRLENLESLLLKLNTDVHNLLSFLAKTDAHRDPSIEYLMMDLQLSADRVSLMFPLKDTSE